MAGQGAPRVGLLVTCLVDAIRPRIGFATLQVLEEAGCVVEVPEAQTCCGQPALNSGDAADAADLARRAIAAFEGFDYVVLPSGSCAGTVREHYPELLHDDPVALGFLLVAGTFLAVMMMAWGKRGGPLTFSLLFALLFNLAMFAVAWGMWRRKWFVKV